MNVMYQRNMAGQFVLAANAILNAMKAICPMALNAWWIITIVQTKVCISVQMKAASVRYLCVVRSISGSGIKHVTPIRARGMAAVTVQMETNSVPSGRHKPVLMVHGLAVRHAAAHKSATTVHVRTAAQISMCTIIRAKITRFQTAVHIIMNAPNHPNTVKPFALVGFAVLLVKMAISPKAMNVL